jgi:hypothetical protein
MIIIIVIDFMPFYDLVSLTPGYWNTKIVYMSKLSLIKY